MKTFHYLSGICCFLLLSCKKELPVDNYTAQFWGTNDATETAYNELDILLELTDVEENYIVFNDDIVLDRVNDSIQGTLTLAKADYVIHPYIIGTWQKENKQYVISGSYAALKDSLINVEGTFEIRQDN